MAQAVHVHVNDHVNVDVYVDVDVNGLFIRLLLGSARQFCVICGFVRRLLY